MEDNKIMGDMVITERYYNILNGAKQTIFGKSIRHRSISCYRIWRFTKKLFNSEPDGLSFLVVTVTKNKSVNIE